MQNPVDLMTVRRIAAVGARIRRELEADRIQRRRQQERKASK